MRLVQSFDRTCAFVQIVNVMFLIALITIKPFKKGKGNLTFACFEYLALTGYLVVCLIARLQESVNPAAVYYDPLLHASPEGLSLWLRVLLASVGLELIVVFFVSLLRAQPIMRYAQLCDEQPLGKSH